MYGPFPPARPAGLRRRRVTAGTVLWRIDASDPRQWSWAGFPTARARFDPSSGGFRVRYAATTVDGALRERYLDTGRYVPPDHGDHHLVRLVARRELSVVDLRTEGNLDALDVDDRISTSHEPVVWDACHRLADAVRSWWPDLDGIVYRSRTTPTSSANLAFFASDAFRAGNRRLAVCRAELDDLVLRHDFTVGFEF